MKELRFVNPDYETRSTENPARFPEAGRLVRMAFSVGGIIDVPLELYADALNAYERMENDVDAEEHRYTADEVAILAELFEHIRVELDASIDEHYRVRGSSGQAIAKEAKLPRELDGGEVDDDRVFQFDEDGRIGTVYPRMSLPDFRERFARLVSFLQEAASRKLEVAVVG